ncbi:MAG: OmpA family protein [Deltaproteobacteria bacterium]|nr:MAG: OmpA family protein [Deltaproteobacteria bacterium]
MRPPFLRAVPTEENPFALSVGDLMAALLLIFILLLSSTLLRLEKEFQRKREETEAVKRAAEQIQAIAQTYKRLKEDLYEDLYREFAKDLERWDAVIDQKTLSVRFREPEVLFGVGDARLKPRFKEILRDFFPRYIGILLQEAYRDNIEEIRIEGHTSSEWNRHVSSDLAYIYNMRLSQDRTRSVLSFCLDLLSGARREWARSKITANGLSFSKRILRDGVEDKKASRRVEFRVRTDAERQIGEILGIGFPSGKTHGIPPGRGGGEGQRGNAETRRTQP